MNESVASYSVSALSGAPYLLLLTREPFVDKLPVLTTNTVSLLSSFALTVTMAPSFNEILILRYENQHFLERF